MNIIQKEYPKIFSKLEDKDIDEIRYLVVVDENYDDLDTDEFDVFDPDEYSHIVYIDERIQNILGQKMQDLIELLRADENFENFIDAEIDNYGVKTNMNEEEIAKHILKIIEERLV